MAADPITTLTIAVLFGGGSGGLVSWWVKASVERAWKDRARELDAKVAEQVKETEQLRAHSLGLEAERRRSFETKRAEACVEVAAALCRVEWSAASVFPDYPPRPGDRPDGRGDQQRLDDWQAFANSIREARKVLGQADLYLLEAGRRVVFEAIGQAQHLYDTEDPHELPALQRTRRGAQEELRRFMLGSIEYGEPPRPDAGRSDASPGPQPPADDASSRPTEP